MNNELCFAHGIAGHRCTFGLDEAKAEIASLRAALAAEREAHATTKRARDQAAGEADAFVKSHDDFANACRAAMECAGRVLPLHASEVPAWIVRLGSQRDDAQRRANEAEGERDAALARAEAAERERNVLQTIRETNLDHIADLSAVGQRLMCERDEARAEIARLEAIEMPVDVEQAYERGWAARAAATQRAERERDEFRRLAEASLTVPCACGRPMPSVSSRLRCDACRAEGERDEARAAVVAMREAIESARLTVVRHSRDWSRHDSDAWLYGLLVGWPVDVIPQLPGAWPQNPAETARLSRLRAALSSDAGAPLLAELRALRAVREAADAFLSPPTLHAIGDARARLRAALDAAKGGG